MGDNEVLKEFVSIFAKIDGVEEVSILDTSLNPVKGLTNARTVLNDSSLRDFLMTISKAENVTVTYNSTGDSRSLSIDSKVLQEFSKVFDDIKRAFPPPERDSRLDLLCKLDSENFVMVELQVVTQPYWDKRALAYCAGAYASQLRKGDKWKDLMKVTAVNLLGKGVSDEDPWKDYPNEFCRHYKFITEGRSPSLVIDQMELIQYCIPHLIQGVSTFQDEIKRNSFSEWAEFFQNAHLRTEDEVQKVTSDAVKRAYKRARTSDFPEWLRDQYFKEELRYNEYAESIKQTKEAAKEEAMEEVSAFKAKSISVMLQAGIQADMIATSFGIPLQEVEAIRAAPPGWT